MAAHNNYFRVHGTVDFFTFDDSDPDSLASALAQAVGRANYHRSSRTPEILVWRRTSHPSVCSLSQIGDRVPLY